MKQLTSSHSSSPSTSSIFSLDQSFKSATAIIHRILCSGGLPTHSSDQIIELDSMQSDKVQEFKAKKNTEAVTSPSTHGNVVARLMGLDLKVEIPFEEKNPTSLLHSKSMNSVDYLGESKAVKGLHRCDKSSSSFHEAPTFHLFQNENFLVLSFEGGSESKEFKSKGRKNEKGYAELKQKQRERRELKKNKRETVHDEKKGNLRKSVCDKSSINVGNDGELENIANTSLMFKVSSSQEVYIDSEIVRFSQCLKYKEVHNGEKVKRRKKRRTLCTDKKVETECSSEDSSPVSVFDFDREAPGADVDSCVVGSGWRRKLSPELENDQLFSLNSDSNLIIEERKVKTKNNNNERSMKKEKQNQECVHIWGEICRLVEYELVGSNHLKEEMRKQSDLASISADFESEIFDELLNDMIDQLVGNPLKTLQLQYL
ncbi:hypothetical protein TanjilG_32176 [Lupinus angustifolius]|uniref:DUF3741 domain-containing protein n=1 Tax=Lupinus angustifolius TaxID=3871 RepID=A0A1J7HUL2_LUPAN|nr:PREDICTED: uncharacterized protein LOC109338961 [Lupinus angustifolius]OIW16506.1 hypothetical protein TanjilG_32176 [Lupinus angustifolius]